MSINQVKCFKATTFRVGVLMEIFDHRFITYFVPGPMGLS
jgi:hypothetical protein